MTHDLLTYAIAWLLGAGLLCASGLLMLPFHLARLAWRRFRYPHAHAR